MLQQLKLLPLCCLAPLCFFVAFLFCSLFLLSRSLLGLFPFHFFFFFISSLFFSFISASSCFFVSFSFSISLLAPTVVAEDKNVRQHSFRKQRYYNSRFGACVKAFNEVQYISLTKCHPPQNITSPILPFGLPYLLSILSVYIVTFVLLGLYNM